MKKLLLGATLLSLLLTSCATTPSFYNKTFVYKGTHNTWDNTLQGDTTARKELEKNFSKVDWAKAEITDHSSVDVVISQITKTCDQNLRVKYGDLKIAIASEQSKQATFTNGTQSEVYKTSFAEEDKMNMNFSDSNDTIKHALYCNYAENGNFVRTTLKYNGDLAMGIFELYYTEMIEGYNCLQVTYFANFLPQ